MICRNERDKAINVSPGQRLLLIDGRIGWAVRARADGVLVRMQRRESGKRPIEMVRFRAIRRDPADPSKALHGAALQAMENSV
jgi:hypothetical protein